MPHNSYLLRRRVVITCVILAITLWVAASQAQTPVGYWTFDEGSGIQAADSSGNGHAATLVSGVSWVPGEIGSAVSANAATQQYVSIPAINLSNTKAATVAFWSKRTYLTTGGHALFEATSDYTNSTTGFGFFPDDATCGGIQAALRGDVGYTANCYSQPSSGVWHHLAVVFDKSQTGGNQVRFYVDGILQTVNWSLNASTNTNNFGNNPIYLFSRGGTNEFNSGAIDDFRIYNSALTDAQIQKIYNSTRLVSLAVTPNNPTLTTGQRQQFTAIGTYKDGSTKDLSSSVTWTSSIPSVAIVSNSGLATAVAVGSTTIQATSGSINGSAALTASVANMTAGVADLAQAMSIAYVQGNSATPQQPQTAVSITFIAAQAAGDLNVVVVGWNDSTATVSSITDSKGNVYARAVGPTTVNGYLSQSIYYAKNIAAAAAGANTVTVTFSTPASYPDIRILEYSGADPNNPVDVTAANTGSSANSSSGSATTTNATDLIFGANIVATATSGPGSGFTKRLLTSPDGDIAEDQMVAATGSYSATAPLSSGRWIMQMVAFRTSGGGPQLVSIAVTPANASIAAGTQQQYTATGTYSDGSHQNLTSSVTWTSSATTVATISSGGLATGVAAGSTTIRATSGSISGSTGLTVTAATLLSIAVTPANASIAAGQQQQFTATGTYSDGSHQNLTSSATWTSSATTVATIGSGGLATGVAAGSTTIRATSGSISGSTGLTVTAATLLSIAVTPANASIAAGQQQQFTATGTYSDGSHQNLTSSATWTSSATTVATIGSGGLATGVAAGSTTIRATSGSVSGSATLTVTATANFTIAASPASLSVVQGNQGTSTITTTVSGGFNSAITLSAAGVPSGTTVSFSPNPIAAPGSGSSSMTITVGANTPTGTYPITVTGNGGGIQHTAAVTLTVASTTISYVQGNYAIPQTPQSTVSVTFNAAQSAGNLNVVAVGWNDSTATVTSVVDAKGNTYTRAVGPTIVSGTLSQSIYYAKNIAAATAGSNAVTVTFSSAATSPDIRILEYSGADPSSPVDVTAANSGNSATSSSGSATTTNATDLIFGADIVATLTSGPGSGFSRRLLTSPDGDIAEDQMVTTTGSYGASAPLTSAGPWIMQMVAFRTDPPALVSIAVSPTNASIVAAGQQQFTATGTYSDGSQQNLTNSATWTSSATSVATINTTGLATGIAQGSTTIRATSGQISGSATLTVTGSGNFTISASPASLSVLQGNQGSSTITTTINGGFNASIALSAAGAPTGTTVSFNPAAIAAPGAGSSTMTVTVGASTPTGTYPITVTGNGGGIQHTATVTLTVTAAPNFTISASPASLSVLHGNQGSSTITTTISGGFNASIALSASGAPTGTTVSFNPATIAAPGAGNSTMTITVGASTPTGTYVITVTGSGGGIMRTVTVSLTVTAQVALSWTASTSQGVVGYNAYRSLTSGGPYTKVNSSLIAATSYTDQTVQSGLTYYYVATAVNAQQVESSYSNQAVATVP